MMKNSTGERIRALRTFYDLSVKEFATFCGLSHVAIFHIESGKTARPHKTSLVRMAAGFGTTVDWLLYGHDQMLPQGRKDLNLQSGAADQFWTKEAYLELKNRNQMLEKELERVWQVVHQLSGLNKNRLEMLDAG